MSVPQAATRAQVEAEEDRRHTHRSDPAFQNRFRLALMQLVAAALVPAAALSLGVSYVVQHPEILPDSPWVPIAFTAAGVAAGLLILRRCDKVSNRYCGPTRRMIQTLESIRRGERPAPVRVRKGDEFEHLVKELNETFVELGAMDDPAR
jgi:F0F1-type ATP synthase assembly protein I